jgi:hypothetical protein
MKVFGMSQSTGEERELEVEGADGGIVLTIRGRAGGAELERILVKEDDLLPAITDPTPGGRTVEGTSPAHRWRMLLGVEIRRNEVWLTARPATAKAAVDVAVGLDDFQDALERAIGPA